MHADIVVCLQGRILHSNLDLLRGLVLSTLDFCWLSAQCRICTTYCIQPYTTRLYFQLVNYITSYDTCKNYTPSFWYMYLVGFFWLRNCLQFFNMSMWPSWITSKSSQQYFVLSWNWRKIYHQVPQILNGVMTLFDRVYQTACGLIGQGWS